MAAGRQRQQRRVETKEEEPPLQPRRSQNLKVSLAEISDAPAVRIPPFPARGEASIGERPCAKPASHPIEAAGAARRRKAEGARGGRGGGEGDTLLRPAAQQSTPSPTNTPTHSSKARWGSPSVPASDFLPGKRDCLFPNKSEILGKGSAATQHEQDKNKSGRVAPKGEGARGGTSPPVSGRERRTGERERERKKNFRPPDNRK